ncbi:MAG: DUF4382 domain-containing protein [Nitrospiraceae bacterium]|nr:DUF4382 domain-containing protein [Nitrospiraceae bacterium]
MVKRFVLYMFLCAMLASCGGGSGSGIGTGASQELGLLPLEAGHYQQIRLIVVPNSGTEPPFSNSVVYSQDGEDVEVPLTIPTEDTTGIKVIHQFTVEEGKTVDLVLDLDGKKSVVAQGNGKFMLKPVIKATVMQPAS